jgi:hypothetical protein
MERLYTVLHELPRSRRRRHLAAADLSFLVSGPVDRRDERPGDGRRRTPVTDTAATPGRGAVTADRHT